MPNEIAINEPVVDTLSLLDKLPFDDGDSSVPIINEDKEDDKEEPEGKLELTDTEEDPEIADDEIDFSPAINKKALLKEFPEIFKKFPQLQRAIYLERQYTELFPTIADAKQVAARAEVLTNAEGQLLQGNTEQILKSVKDEDPEAFKRIIDNFLPTVDKLDRGSYLHVVGNIGRGFIKMILAEVNRVGKETEQGQHLLNGAIVLNQALFGNSNWQEPVNLAKPIDPNSVKQNEKVQELQAQRFNDVQQSLSARANNAIKAAVTQYIDPKESMTPFVRDTAIDRCLIKLDEMITSDTGFKAKLDRLWENVVNTNFSQAAQDKVKAAYFAKAQVLLPDIIKSVRVLALAGTRTRKADKEVENNERTNSGRSTADKSGREPKQYPRGMSTMDILNSELGD